MLFHLHGVGPVLLTFKDQNLGKFAILLHFLRCDRLLLVNILLSLFMGLSEFKVLAKTKHSSTAVGMVSAIVIVTETILVLCSFNEKHNTLLVGSIGLVICGIYCL